MTRGTGEVGAMGGASSSLVFVSSAWVSILRGRDLE